MKTLALKLQEGILDDMDDILDNVEAGAVDDWLKEYASGKYKTMKLKNGTRKVWGTLIIKNFREAGLARYARAQKSRYAGIIAKNKVMKGYKKRTEATAKLFERYANFIRKTTEDLDWYADHSLNTIFT